MNLSGLNQAVCLRRIQPSNPSPEPNSHAAAGTVDTQREIGETLVRIIVRHVSTAV